MKNIRRKVTLSILLILLFSIDGRNSAKEVAVDMEIPCVRHLME